MRSVTVFFAEEKFSDLLIQQAKHWRGNELNGMQFTYMAPAGMPIFSVGRKKTNLALHDKPHKANGSLSLTTIEPNRTLYYRPEDCFLQLYAQSLYSDLVVMSLASYLQYLQYYRAISDTINPLICQCPIYIPGANLPAERLLVFLQVNAVKFAANHLELLAEGGQLVLFASEESTAEHTKRLLAYAQTYCPKVGLAQLDKNSDLLVKQFITQNAIIIGSVGDNSIFGKVINRLLTESPQPSHLSYILL